MQTISNKAFSDGQWLAHSLGWTVGALGGWVLFVVGLQNLPGDQDDLFFALSLGSAVGVHALLWWKAVASGWVHRPPEAPWRGLGATLWLLGLLAFQGLCLLALLFALLLACDPSNGGNWALAGWRTTRCAATRPAYRPRCLSPAGLAATPRPGLGHCSLPLTYSAKS